jgi:hypothetical protein
VRQSNRAIFSSVRLRPNLLEYLARPVFDSPLRGVTELTEADEDEYDAPEVSGIPMLLTSEVILAATLETRTDGDTFDDDAGLSTLSAPFSAMDLTVKTSMSSDTYDEDMDISGATTPVSMYGETYVTKTENETYDDEPSIGSLSFPVS